MDLWDAQESNGGFSICGKAIFECLDPLRRPEGEIHDGTGSAIVCMRSAALV